MNEKISNIQNQDVRDLLELVRENNVIDSGLYPRFNVKRGLRNADGTGVLVGLTSIGEVHGYIFNENEKVDVQGKLSYRGIDVSDIVNECIKTDSFGFEEVVYLLLFGELPNNKQLDRFSNLLKQYRDLPENFIEDMILKSPSPDIMNKLARATLSLYSNDPTPDDCSLDNIFRQSLQLIARFPSLIAYAYQAKAHYYDNKSLYIHSPNPELSMAENFLYMMRPDNHFSHEEAQILDLCLILHAEHGGGNNSAFTTHVVASSGTDTYSAIAAAVSSLKGPKHGGANHRVMQMMEDIKSHVKDWGNEKEIRDYLTKIFNKEANDHSGLVYGMGHAVYTLSDPRAIILKSQAERLAKQTGHLDEFKLYDAIERITPELYCEIKKTNKVISANVDLYSGFVYSMLGIPPELYTPLFAMSRVVGWCAHRIEEELCGGKIIRPAYKSISKGKPYIPREQRQ